MWGHTVYRSIHNVSSYPKFIKMVPTKLQPVIYALAPWELFGLSRNPPPPPGRCWIHGVKCFLGGQKIHWKKLSYRFLTAVRPLPPGSEVKVCSDCSQTPNHPSGGSRISRRRGMDLVRGGVVDSRGGYVSNILYVKTKKLAPGACSPP